MAYKPYHKNKMGKHAGKEKVMKATIKNAEMSVKNVGATIGSGAVADELIGGGMSNIPGLSAVVSNYLNTYKLTPDDKVGYYCGLDEKINVFVDMITAADAKKLLERNKNNRKMTSSARQRYTRSMSNDKWSVTADMIAFDHAGILINGQHRLQAIVDSEKSIECVIGCNIPFNVQQDRGVKRTIAQNIYMAREELGFVNPYLYDKRLVQMCSFLLTRMRKSGNDTETVVDFMKTNQRKLEEFANVMLDDRYTKILEGINSASFLGATFCAYMNGVDLVFLSKIRDVVATGQYNIKDGDNERFKDVVKLRDIAMEYGLADPNNKMSYFTDVATYIYGAYNYITLVGRGNKKREAQMAAIKKYSIMYDDASIIFPINSIYKRKEKKSKI